MTSRSHVAGESIAYVKGAQGLRLAADLAGPSDGSLVILLHGGGQTRHSWSDAQRRLAEAGYRVIAYDARGHGDSDWSATGDYAFASLADDLREVLAYGGRPAALVGASLGGITSMMALAGDSPPPCWALALVDVVPRMNLDGRARVLEFMAAYPEGFASIDEAIEAISAYLPHRAGRPKAALGAMKNLRMRQGRFYWHWDPAFLKNRLTDLPFAGLESTLQSGIFPVLLVRGGLSDVVTEGDAQSFAAAVPKAEISVITGAAHMVAGDRNDAFGSVILSFLRRAHDSLGSTEAVRGR